MGRSDAVDEDEEADPIMSLKLLDKKLNEIRDKIAAITKTVKTEEPDGRPRLDPGAHSHVRAGPHPYRTCCRNPTPASKTVLANDPLRIARIDKSLHLANQAGASVGQKLSVGYTFLMSALNHRGKVE